jgi:hypothetical protein
MQAMDPRIQRFQMKMFVITASMLNETGVQKLMILFTGFLAARSSIAA